MTDNELLFQGDYFILTSKFLFLVFFFLSKIDKKLILLFNACLWGFLIVHDFKRFMNFR